eukprot:g14759.t1
MHSATTSNNAFAKWETLGPPTTSTSKSPLWAVLSPSSPKVTAGLAPAAAAPPAPPAVSTAVSVQLPLHSPPTPNSVAAARPQNNNNSISSSNSIVGEPFASADDGDRGRSLAPSALAVMPQDGRQGGSHRAAPSSGTSDAYPPSRSSAILPDAAPGTTTPAPPSLLRPPPPEVLASSPAHIASPPVLVAQAPLPPPSPPYAVSVVAADAESLLARLAGKAKQAAAAALSASAASTSPTSSAGPGTGTGATGAALRAGRETPAPAPTAIAFNPDAAGVRGGNAGPATGPGEDGDGDRDERRGRGWGWTAAAAAAPAAEVAVEAGGCARLAELCKEDKAKVARLMQDLVKLRAEKDGQRARFERLRAQNEVIVKEMAALKVKFGQSMQLLRKYQSILQDGGPVVGRGAAAGGSMGVDGGGSQLQDSLAVATDMKSLREALQAAEEASRKAKMEAVAEHAARAAMAGELQRAKDRADDLRRQLDHHRSLRSESSIPVAAGARACQSLDSLNAASVWSTAGAPAGLAPGKTAPLSATGGGDPSAVAHGKNNKSAGSKDDALRASSGGGQAMPVDGVSGYGKASGDERGSARSPRQPSEQHHPNDANAAANGGGDGGGGGSVVPSEGRRTQGGEGVASNAELAAVKEQVETLKQQLVMVGVQQLALTGVPTGAALINRHEGAFPFHRPVLRAPERSVAGDATTAKMGAEVSPFVEQGNGDRASTRPAHQQQQQQRVLGRRTSQPRPTRRRGKDGPPEEGRGCGGSDSSEGEGAPIGEFAGESVLLKGRGPDGGVAGTDDDEEVGWWARSADNLLVLADTIQHERREAPTGDGNHERTIITSGDVADGRSCDRGPPSDPTGKTPLAAERPPAPARKSAGVGAGRSYPARGKPPHVDVDAESGPAGVSTEGAPRVAAVSGGSRLRVSWSSISTRSSESDLERESAPASVVTSASNCSGGGSNSIRTGSYSRRRRGDDDAPGPVSLPRSRPPQRQQRQHLEQGRQQIGSLSPSSYSSSSVFSSAFGRPNGGRARTSGGGAGAGAGAGASRGAAAVGLRHQRIGGAEAAGDGARRVPKPRVPTAVPGSGRKLMQRAPIAGGGITTGTLDHSRTSDAVPNSANCRTARPAGKPAAPSQRTLSDSDTSGRHCRSAVGLERPREHGGGSNGVRGGLPPPSSSALRQGGFANGWQAVAVAPGMRRAAARVMPHHCNGEEGHWRGPPEMGRDRGLRAHGRPPDGDGDDASETLASEGGSFFDGSLLDLIDDLEEERNEAAQIHNNGSGLSSTTGGSGMREGGGWS